MMHLATRWITVTLLTVAMGAAFGAAAAAPPANDPVADHYRRSPDVVPAWVGRLPWQRVVSIADFDGSSDDERFAAAQEALVQRGGGVLYFPAGVYRFRDDLHLSPGVILRGADPAEVTDARADHYAPPTRFVFPRYRPSFKGEGTPIDTAFKAIRLADPTGDDVGVVNIAVEHGRIEFDEADEHRTGQRRLIFGNRLTNAAAADPGVPDAKYGHLPHQRWTARHTAAITIYSGEDAYVANNRIPSSGEDNFVVRNYRLVRPKGNSQNWRPGDPHEIITITDGVLFDYDNRPGIYVNGFALHDGTPETHPWGFRKGTIIRDNFIYCTGRTAIHFTGDGAYAGFNVIRFPAGVWRPTATGRKTTDGSSTNDNRALTMRGYRWTAEGNDYIVHSNLTFRGGHINDGEGIMHEGFANSMVKGSRMIHNRGNRYLCLWDTAIDGLEVRGNIVGDDGDPAIHILGRDHPVHHVIVEENQTTEGAIKVTSSDGSDIHIRNNRFLGDGRTALRVTDPDWVEAGNEGFDVKVE